MSTERMSVNKSLVKDFEEVLKAAIDQVVPYKLGLVFPKVENLQDDTVDKSANMNVLMVYKGYILAVDCNATYCA